MCKGAVLTLPGTQVHSDAQLDTDHIRLIDTSRDKDATRGTRTLRTGLLALLLGARTLRTGLLALLLYRSKKLLGTKGIATNGARTLTGLLASLRPWLPCCRAWGTPRPRSTHCAKDKNQRLSNLCSESYGETSSWSGLPPMLAQPVVPMWPFCTCSYPWSRSSNMALHSSKTYPMGANHV